MVSEFTLFILIKKKKKSFSVKRLVVKCHAYISIVEFIGLITLNLLTAAARQRDNISTEIE